MSNYKPSLPFNVPAFLLIPTTTTVKGVAVKTYPNYKDGQFIYCTFRSFGGTEVTSNGVYSVMDTATVESWYRPDITAGCRMCLATNPDKMYEVIGTPENIEMRNQYIKFKVQAVAGGA